MQGYYKPFITAQMRQISLQYITPPTLQRPLRFQEEKQYDAGIK